MRMKIGPRPTGMSCGHHLEFVPKGHKCGGRHGHSYKVRAWASCDARCFDPEECVKEGLDEPILWVMDYGDLIEAVKSEVYAKLDHTYLNDTIEHPTTEALCLWAWPRIEAHLPDHVRLDELEIHEGDHVCKLSRF